jgi:hypothetical protein
MNPSRLVPMKVEAFSVWTVLCSAQGQSTLKNKRDGSSLNSTNPKAL